MKNDLAPIIVFTYRRVPDKLIDSLLENSLSKESELIIFSDGNKNDNDLKDIQKVREYIKTITGFNTIKIVESKINKGLANSIIDGVTDVIEEYGRVIVLEDDLIVSSDFLDYMNDALNFYKDNKNIWSISGYGPRIPCLEDYSYDIYLSLRVSPWGWATWQDRWEKIDWEVKNYDQLIKDKELKKKFNLAGNDMFKMLELQMLGKIDSWAIRWYYNQFELGLYTIYPKRSKVVNIGFMDDKGTHTRGEDTKWMVALDNEPVVFHDINAQKDIIECFQQYHNLGAVTSIGYFLKKNGGYDAGKKVYEYLKKYIK